MNFDKNIENNIEKLSLGVDASLNGTHREESAKRHNPWKGRAPVQPVTNKSDSASGDSAVDQIKPIESAGESDAWPVPSARRVTVPSITTKTDDRPKKKLNRKWQDVDIPLRDDNTNRGGSRVAQVSTSTQGHNSGLANFRNSQNIQRGGNGNGSRRGMHNGPLNRGRSGRNLNGAFGRPRPTPDDSTESTADNTSSPVNQETVPKPVSVSVALSTGTARGSFQPRGRRAGNRGGHITGNFIPRTLPAPTQPAVGSVSSNPNFRISSVVHPQSITNYQQVNPMTFVVPNPALQVQAVLTQGSLLQTQDTTALPVQPVVAVAGTSANIHSTPVAVAVDERVPERKVIELSELVSIIVEEGLDNVRVSEKFKHHPSVRAAMGENAWPLSEEEYMNNHSEKDEIVRIGNEIYLPLSPAMNKFLHFSNRLDFIRHHVGYYFSEKNLQKDEHLMKLLRENGGVCPFADLLGFRRLQSVNAQESDLVECAAFINSILVVYEGTSKPFGFRALCPYVQNALALQARPATPVSMFNAQDFAFPNPQTITPAASFPITNGAPSLQNNAPPILASLLPFGFPCFPNPNGIPAIPAGTGASDQHVAANPCLSMDNNIYNRCLWDPSQQFAPASFMSFMTPAVCAPFIAPTTPGVMGPAPAFMPNTVPVGSGQQPRPMAGTVRTHVRSSLQRPVSGDKPAEGNSEQNQ
ncbi:hypothetical protein Aperf_G00000099718 [Anoplocephala perfoliata]